MTLTTYMLLIQNNLIFYSQSNGVLQSKSNYTHITWVGAVYILQPAKRFIKKRKLFQPRLYEYNLGSN